MDKVIERIELMSRLNKKQNLLLEGLDLQLGYGEQSVLKNLSLKLRKGEILCLIGANGSGKSTILNTVARLISPLAGKFYLAGEDLKDWSPGELARNLSLLSTGRVQTEKMSCMDIIESGRIPYTGSFGKLKNEDFRIIDQVIETLEVEDLCEKNFMEISDGQKQRILLGRALAQSPELLILDEPTAFLDIRHKMSIVQILRDIADKFQTAMLISLHELDLAQALGDKFLCLKDGEVLAYGNAEDVFTKDLIKELYDLEAGYCPLFNSFEHIPETWEIPPYFVLGGNGKAIPTYRRLQKENTPFVTGILHSNDVDYYLAAEIAQEIVVEKAFQPISAAKLETAKALVKRTPSFINCLSPEDFGIINSANRELLNLAESLGKVVELD